MAYAFKHTMNFFDISQHQTAKVTETDPALKGATATAQYKPAILETGLKITVPPFISIGEILQVDTRDGKYLGRVK